jgi:hypothetical protein
MNASKEMIITGILLVLSMIGGSFLMVKGSTKILTKQITSTIDQVNTVRDYASDFIQLSPTGDYQTINFEKLKEKDILPTNLTVNGTGDSSNIKSPYDQLQTMALIDPNSSSSTLKGKFIRITIDSSSSKFTDTEKQNWEDKLKSAFENAGGTVSGYDTTNADAIISVTFE